MKDRRPQSLTDEQKARVLKQVEVELGKLERKHGVSPVRWAVNRRHARRAERAKLAKEKAILERRLSQIDQQGK